MGKKKRGHPDVEEILSRPWCYYCERDFDDLKILINHQKAKHFKCERCGRRLNTAGGLSVHLTQVHKETLTTIENALPNRSNLDVEIFGMEGIPDDIVNSHNQRVLTSFAQAEAERRAATGNTGPSGASGNGAKKPKFESPSELKQRLAEHKAKKAAELAAGVSSGDATPIDTTGNHSPAFGQPPGYINAPYPQPQMQFNGPPSNATYASYPQTYGQPQAAFQQHPQQFPQQPPDFGPPAINPYGPPQAFSPPPQQYPQPVNPNFAPPQFQSGHPQPQFQPNPPQLQFQSGPPQPQFQPGPPQPSFQPGPPQAQFSQMHPRYGANPSTVTYNQQGQYQPVRTQTPPQRSNSLPPAPGLPQRPSFGAPPVNAFQMLQMHQGQIPGQAAAPFTRQHPSSSSFDNHDQSQQGGQSFGQASPNGNNGIPMTNPKQSSQEISDKSSLMPASVDNHVANAAVDIGQSNPRAESALGVKAEDAPIEKKGKKDKERTVKMVYSDNEVSPEEKMAQLPRYAFTPSKKEGTILVELSAPGVTA